MHIFVDWSKANYLTGRPFCPEIISAGKISGRGVGGNKANDGGCFPAIMVLVRRVRSRVEARMWSSPDH